MTEVERLTAGSYYPLGRDPEWEARRYATEEGDLEPDHGAPVDDLEGEL